MATAPGGGEICSFGEDCLLQMSIFMRADEPSIGRSGLSASRLSSRRSDCRRASAHCVESWAIPYSCWLTAGSADAPAIR
eukprot:184363-Prymnesium_polylepis.1